MKDFLLEILTWWRGNTWGTRLWVAMNGVLVGQDEFGNTYYRSKKPTGPNGRERRMVVYAGGFADASTIPPGWHGWMHYRTDVPPTEDRYAARAWEKPHQRNLTGTALAYRQMGACSTRANGRGSPRLRRLVAGIGALQRTVIVLTTRPLTQLRYVAALLASLPSPTRRGVPTVRSTTYRLLPLREKVPEGRMRGRAVTAKIAAVLLALITAAPALADTIANPVAAFSGLDKIAGRITKFDVYIDETVQFGALQITPRVCYTRPPTETQRTSVFVEVDQVSLKGQISRIFTGWMFADSPALNAIDHAV